MEIASLDNPQIKNLKKLKQKKYREKSGQFVVENWLIIQDAWQSGFSPLAIFFTPSFIAKNKPVLEHLIKASGLKDYFIINEKINKSFSNLETPMGIAALYKMPSIKKSPSDQSSLYLNSIGDPGNLGTILRSALAFDFKNIILDETCADVYNFKTINAAKDAIFKVNISYDQDLKILKQLKSQVPIVATEIQKGIDLKNFKVPKIVCLVLGDESRGVDKNILALADKLIKIKISGAIESLNVASAAAIILHHFYTHK